ncbi:MAG: dual specificity protein phosphatase family protein [Bdellovibrionota bacterium]|nr:dual specificity protein phosphatase family protein [Bdellovibrionota bacterium]
MFCRLSSFLFASLFCSLNLFAGILGDNFHEIDEARYYRSAQLSAKKFAKYVEKYGIKTVINLRGESSKQWFQEEKEILHKMNVSLHSIGMSARRLPHREDLLKLLELFETAERPILVHCQGGADRTGEASALYQMLYMGKSKEQALKMLRIKYHHLSWRHPAKRYFIKDIWQGKDWTINNYYPCENSDWKYYKREDFCESKPEAIDYTH